MNAGPPDEAAPGAAAGGRPVLGVAPHATTAAADLPPTTWAMLKALRAGRHLSRNRHFALFERPEIRKALRIHRFLTSVVADLRRAEGDLAVTRVRTPAPPPGPAAVASGDPGPDAAVATGPSADRPARHRPPEDGAWTAGAYGLRIELRHLHGRRTVYLTAWELALLAEAAPEVAARLESLLPVDGP